MRPLPRHALPGPRRRVLTTTNLPHLRLDRTCARAIATVAVEVEATTADRRQELTMIHVMMAATVPVMTNIVPDTIKHDMTHGLTATALLRRKTMDTARLRKAITDGHHL